MFMVTHSKYSYYEITKGIHIHGVAYIDSYGLKVNKSLCGNGVGAKS